MANQNNEVTPGGVAFTGPDKRLTERKTEPVLDGELDAVLAQVRTGSLNPLEGREKIKELYRERLIYDDLTKVATRREGLRILNRELVESKRNPGHLTAVMFVDVDGLKPINDADQSHKSGDELLVRLARSLVKTSEGRGDVARYAGDEFLVIAHATTQAELVQLGQELGQGMYRDGVGTTVSVGLAFFNPETDTEPILVDRADKLMYAAKQAGRDRMAVQGREEIVKFG